MQRVKEVEMAFSGSMMACREDWASLCYHAGAPTGGGEIMRCLRANEAKLSPRCLETMKKGSGAVRKRSPGMP
jgi:hypothetical protein